MTLDNNKRWTAACYTVNISMAIVGNLSPLLFLTFRSLYGISYSLLGLLVLINFVTQLSVDLAFSFFSHKFNIPKVVKLTPVLTIAGLLLYAAAPLLFPNAVYLGLVLGTIVFSAASGFAEVLISPVIAAIPSDNPDHAMSKLHSIYAWGVVGVIVVGTVFLFGLGQDSWQWFALLLTIVPISSLVLFFKTKFPKLETPERVSGVFQMMKNKTLWLCVVGIFLGGAAECTMAQWSSSYLEQAVGLPKIWGDIFGVALFSVMLGLGRSLYAKYGHNIEKMLLLGAIGAASCYFLAAVSDVAIIGLVACAFTGFCVSMMWPGSLIAVAERIPAGGVFMYALMASGGDLGASIGPQLVGVVTDTVAANSFWQEMAAKLMLTPEQLGMKIGMLVGMLFPLIGIAIYARLLHGKRRNQTI